MYAIVPVRDTTHTRVRHSIRLWAKCNYERRRKVYKRNRYRVEQVIGIVKNRFGDRDCVRDFHTASLYVLARFALYNLMYRLLLLCLNLLRAYMSLLFLSLRNLGIFPTGSQRVLTTVARVDILIDRSDGGRVRRGPHGSLATE